MYSGWLSFAGTEIANEVRVRAYAKELIPRLNMPVDCRDREAAAVLHEVLGDNPYSTPTIDEAPWFDLDDPDSRGFCGFLPTSIIGLTDSTRDATVIESVYDGGSVTGVRQSTREVRVAGLLIGVDDAAVAYGKQWLKSTLDGNCESACNVDELCFLRAVPDTTTVMGDYVTDVVQSRFLVGPTGRWNLTTGVFSPSGSTQSLDTPPAPVPLPCDEIEWTWAVTGTAGTVVVLETLGEAGLIASDQFTLTGGADLLTISDKGLPDHKAYSRLRIITPSRTATVSRVLIEYRQEGDPKTCFDRYLRRARAVTCVDGPRTVREYRPSSGAMQMVEFTIVAGSPHLFGADIPVAEAEGATLRTLNNRADIFKMNRTIAPCTEKKRAPLVIDPDVPKIPTPPRPTIPSVYANTVAWAESFAVYIPDDVIPTWTDVVPVLSIRTGRLPARAVQVRFLARPLTVQAPEELDPCGTCGAFMIDYIPPNSTFTLNGMEQRAYITQPGEIVTSGDHLLSGVSSDQLFEWPSLSCGLGYYAIVDVAANETAGLALSVVTKE